MLFSSHVFLFVFLPVVLTLAFAAARVSRDLAKATLIAASVFFYGYWDPRYVPLLLALVAFTYGIAWWLWRLVEQDSPLRTPVLVVGLAGNIGALAYFKYTNFVVAMLGAVLARKLDVAHVVLPLGISFIAFQKIAFLVDVHAGAVKRVRLLDYALFVTFFPQLIAGPIVHHRDVIPQFEGRSAFRASALNLAGGLTLFAIGLFKKAALADALAPTATAVYAAAAAGGRVDLLTAWSGGIHYLLQLYFDFSGYSDMAVGLAMLFGVHLPYNFNSPYKALGFIDYWQRWHITLTRFLTAYVYNPLALRLTRMRMAAGKKATVRGRMLPTAFVTLLAFPTLATMFVSGLWHGAGFQFIVFGLLHGAYLVVEHAWRTFWKERGAGEPTVPQIALGRAITMLGVLAGSVFFRADSVAAAGRVLKGMVGLSGIGRFEIQKEPWRLALVLGLVAVTQWLPNSQEFLGATVGELRADAGAEVAKERAGVAWRPSVGWAVAIGVLAFVGVTQISDASVFLYFNF